MKDNELFDENDLDCIPNHSLISTCCGAPPLGEIYDPEIPGCQPVGLCSKCRDHTTFEQEIEQN